MTRAAPAEAQHSRRSADGSAQPQAVPLRVPAPGAPTAPTPPAVCKLQVAILHTYHINHSPHTHLNDPTTTTILGPQPDYPSSRPSQRNERANVYFPITGYHGRCLDGNCCLYRCGRYY